jgi:hypothetical protein
VTTPALSVNVKGKGRHYPYPPVDPTDFVYGSWRTVDFSKLPEGVEVVPSITNVNGVLGKGEGLLYWSGECAVRSLYRDGFPKDVDRAVELHRGAFRQARDKRADAGTRAHTIAEALTLDTPLPESLSDQDEAYADAFLKFVADHDPEWLHVEATVAHPAHRYAGTADWFARIDGKVVVGDYKTRGKAPDPAKRKKYGLLYEGNRMQLAALAYAPALYVEDDGGWKVEPSPFPVDEGWGVVLFPDGSYDIEVLDEDDLDRWFDGFLGCRRLWGALKGAAA